MEIFKSLDHRKILQQLIDDRKGDGFNFAQLAQQIGVQKTYVSRVMSEGACWSSDQAFAITETFRLPQDSAEYFCTLVELERCGLKSRKEKLKNDIKKIRRRNLRTANVLTTEPIDGRSLEEAEYFADPYHSIVHVFLSMPQYQKGTRSLAKTLGVDHGVLLSILQRLARLKVIKFDLKTDSVELLKSSIHTPSGSTLAQGHQLLFRSLALDRIHRCSPERRNSFSVVFAGDKSLQESIWAEFLNFLERTEKMAKSSVAEEVFSMQFDLFPWVDTN